MGRQIHAVTTLFHTYIMWCVWGGGKFLVLKPDSFLRLKWATFEADFLPVEVWVNWPLFFCSYLTWQVATLIILVLCFRSFLSDPCKLLLCPQQSCRILNPELSSQRKMCLWPCYGYLLWVSGFFSLVCGSLRCFWEQKNDRIFSRKVTITNQSGVCFPSLHTLTH